MSEDIALKAAMPSAFDVEERTDKHIIDVLIEERCPSFRAHFTWPVVRPILFSVLGYRKARQMAEHIDGMPGRPAFDWLAQRLDVQNELTAFERFPRTGRCVVAANHPTGLADGVAMWDALRRYREDVVFFANADAMRVNPDFADVIIPVEWVMDKRSPAKARETLRRASEAFAEEKCVVIFPSGKLARKIDGELREQDWFPTFLSLARKQRAPLVPIGVKATNSWLYYTLSKVSGELRDITLFHELLNKRGAKFEMTCGNPIDPNDIEGDPATVTPQLRDYVSYKLTADPDAEFTPKTN